jgi:hypothetical protein
MKRAKTKGDLEANVNPRIRVDIALAAVPPQWEFKVSMIR